MNGGSEPESAAASPRVVGTCHVLFAFDVGFGINLDQARSRLSEHGHPRTIIGERPDARALEYRPKPLRATDSPVGETASRSIAGFTVSADTEATLFDFGAICIAYAIPFSATLDRLLDLSIGLYGHEELEVEARAHVEELLRTIEPMVTRPSISKFVEDYVVYAIRPDSLGMDGAPGAPSAFIDRHHAVLTRILRAEPRPLSADEMQDALACRISYTTDDATLIDWNASIVIQDDATDLLSVLEFANVELLEMRHLDQQLDDAVDEAYRVVQDRSSRGLRALLLGKAAERTERIAQMQMDSALLFEGVNNALKLLGDQYLARVYRLAAHRLHLPEWDASILRKIDTLNEIYTKMTDRQSNLRMEILEWIIILLIAFEVVKSLLA